MSASVVSVWCIASADLFPSSGSVAIVCHVGRDCFGLVYTWASANVWWRWCVSSCGMWTLKNFPKKLCNTTAEIPTGLASVVKINGNWSSKYARISSDKRAFLIFCIALFSRFPNFHGLPFHVKAYNGLAMVASRGTNLE